MGIHKTVVSYLKMLGKTDATNPSPVDGCCLVKWRELQGGAEGNHDNTVTINKKARSQ